MVELVQAVVTQKVFQGGVKHIFVFVFAHGPSHQCWSSVAHIACDYVPVQFLATDVAKRGIDGMNQVQPRVDQSAIEIKDEQPQIVGIELSQETNHECSE